MRGVGHAVHRLKMSAVFWPPNPNELLSATRIVARRRHVGGQVEPGASGSGSVRLIVGGMQPSRIDRIVTIASIAPAAAERVAEHRLVGRDRHPAGVVAEDRPDGLQLGLVALGRRGRVGVDVVDVGRRRGRPSRAPAGPPGPRRSRRVPGSVMCDASAVAPYPTSSARISTPRASACSSDSRIDHAGAFADDEAVATGIERPRRAGRIVVPRRERPHRRRSRRPSPRRSRPRRRRRSSRPRRRGG